MMWIAFIHLIIKNRMYNTQWFFPCVKYYIFMICIFNFTELDNIVFKIEAMIFFLSQKDSFVTSNT